MDNAAIESYKLDVIKQINKYRNNHGANNLTNDSKIDKIAQKFVEKLSKTGNLDYSYNQYKGEDLGESVYESEVYIAPMKLAKIFYDENIDYDYKNKNPEPSNFTQMVWKSTEFIGFGMQKSLKGKYFFVINYFPTGNIDGLFKKNVFPSGTKVSETPKNTKTNNTNKENNKKESFVNKNNKNEYKKEKKEKDIPKKNDDSDTEENNEDESVDDEYEYKYVSYKKKSKTKKVKDNKIDKKNILSELINNKKKELSQKSDNKTETETEVDTDYQYSSSDYASTSEYNDFYLEALDAHNTYRKKHHVGPLKLNKEICKIAEDYAKKLAYEIGYLKHSENCYNDDILGENLFFCEGMDATGIAVTKNWYGENKKHNYTDDWKNGTGHFTQMVWKETKEVGFGKCKNKGKTFVVANYFPAGNVLGFFKYNVFEP